MSEGGPDGMLVRREQIMNELRSRLRLPEWSNLRGDDVITLVESLDPVARAEVNDLFVELRELEDERTRR